MNNTKSQTEIVARRAELLAELFLQDLGATLVQTPASPDIGYDFVAAFPNDEGGTNFSAVEVKATEKPVGESYPLDMKWYKRLARSNIPALLLVVDAKQNRLYYAWPGEQKKKANSEKTVRVQLTAIDDVVKEQIRSRLASGNIPKFS